MAAGRSSALRAVYACGLLAAACNNGNRVAERVSCYPACLADVVQHCPMLSACDTSVGTNMQITNADLTSGTAACYASGEKRWQATNATTNADTIVVKHADGSECYTAISNGPTMRYTITVGGNTVAELAVDPQSSTSAITCGGTSTAVTANGDCSVLPWTTAICQLYTCDFGELPAGSAAATTK